MKNILLGGLFVASLCERCGRREKFFSVFEKNPFKERETADSLGFEVGRWLWLEAGQCLICIRSIRILSNKQPHP